MSLHYEIWTLDQYKEPATFVGITASLDYANMLAERYVRDHAGTDVLVGIGYTHVNPLSHKTSWLDYVIWE